MREINKIYLIHFFAGLTNIASVTFTLYFLSHGLNQAQIGFLFGIFMIIMSIFNIPTGAFADIFGHKLSVFIGLLLQSLSFLLFFSFPNYSGFFWGFIVSGLGFAFQTGALSSLIYEILRKENLHQNLQQVYGRAGAYFLLGAVIASPIGSFIYKNNQGLPYFLAFIFMLLASIVMYVIKWEYTRKAVNLNNYFRTINEGVRLTMKNKVLVGIVIIGSVLTMERLVFNQNIIQPYQIKIGIDVAYIGIVAALISGVSALASYNSHKIYKYLGKRLALFALILIPSFSLLILSFINTLLALPFIFLFVIGHTLRDPIFSHITQEEIEDDKRSTMSSTIGFLTAIIAGLTLAYWGKGIDILGISNLMFVLGVATFTIGVIGFFIINRKKKAVL